MELGRTVSGLSAPHHEPYDALTDVILLREIEPNYSFVGQTPTEVIEICDLAFEPLNTQDIKKIAKQTRRITNCMNFDTFLIHTQIQWPAQVGSDCGELITQYCYESDEKEKVLANFLREHYREKNREEKKIAALRQLRFENELRAARKRRAEKQKLARSNRVAKRNRIELEGMSEMDWAEAQVWAVLGDLQEEKKN